MILPSHFMTIYHFFKQYHHSSGKEVKQNQKKIIWWIFRDNNINYLIFSNESANNISFNMVWNIFLQKCAYD